MKVIYLALAGGAPEHDSHKISQMETWASEAESEYRVIWMHGDPTISEPQLRGRDLFLPVQETYENLLEKTLYAIRWIHHNLEFDFLIRTNTSNYFYHPLVLSHLKGYTSNDRVAGGVIAKWRGTISARRKQHTYISGAGIFLSAATTEILSKMNVEEKAIHQNLRENLEKAYNDVRLLSHNLLPEEFEKQGLTTILQGFVRKMNKNSTIKFELEISENFGRVDNKIEFELYSICLELVNNIIKHSKATEAKINLTKKTPPSGVGATDASGQIELIISDNGIGTFKNDSDGKGMKNVKARVESLNGTFVINSIDNQGVNIQITVTF